MSNHLDSLLSFYDQIPTLSEERLEQVMEDKGWSVNIDRAGEQGEHEIRFSKGAEQRGYNGRAMGKSRIEALRKAAQASVRNEIGPSKCFTLGLI